MKEPHNQVIMYRLGEYKLIEYDSVLLWWEKHAALGEQRRGRCIILGDVLIIGHQISRENGFLIGEFLEQLEKFPAWNKTRYYCLASGLMDVITGNNLTSDFLERRLSLVNRSHTGLKSNIRLTPANFRLGQYQITISRRGELSWQQHHGLNRVSGGQCVIESGILFIGEQQYDNSGENRQEFFDRLHQFPPWEKTKVWGHRQVLWACEQAQQTKKYHAAIWQRNILKKQSINEKTRVTFHTLHGKKAKRLFLSVFEKLKTVWQGAHLWGHKRRVFREEKPSEKQHAAIWKQDTLKKQSVSEKTGAAFAKFREEKNKRLLFPGFEKLKTVWRRNRGGKVLLKYFVPVILAGLLFALIMAFYVVKEKFHPPHGHKEHHHEHDD